MLFMVIEKFRDGDAKPVYRRFKEKGRTAVWWNPRFVYIGRSQRGLDLRVFYFKGAKLKATK